MKIGINMEVYINGTIIKSKISNQHLLDVQETFNTLIRFDMKLNPEKYAFGL